MPIDWTKPIRTTGLCKDGRRTPKYPARLIAVIKRPAGEKCHLVAITDSDEGDDGTLYEDTSYYPASGAYWNDGEQCYRDLENYVPETEPQGSLL